MPVFFLNVVHEQADPGNAVRTEARNLDHARGIAMLGIRDILSHEVSDGGLDLRWQIDISSADGTVLASVPFADAIRIKRNHAQQGQEDGASIKGRTTP